MKNTKLIKKYRLIIFLGVLLGVFLGTRAILYLKPVPLTVLNVYPPNQTENVPLDLKTIQIGFNRPLKKTNEIKIIVSPAIDFNREENKTVVLLKLKEKLKSGTIYGLEIQKMPAQILIYSWSFKTKEIMKTGRGDVTLFDFFEKNTGENYPLAPFVPYHSQNFSLDYIGPRHLQVVLKGEDKESIKEEVFAWIKSQGIDPSTHKIDFVKLRE